MSGKTIHPLQEAMQLMHSGTIDMSTLQAKMKQLASEAKQIEKQEKIEQMKRERALQPRPPRIKKKPKTKTKTKPIVHSMTRRSTVKQVLSKKQPTPQERLSMLQITGTQVCSRCREEKEEKEFYRSISLATGIRRRCIDCHYDVYNKRPRDNFIRQMFIDSRSRASKKNWNFNLELKDLHELFDKQKGKCALSGVPMTFIHKRGEREFTRNPTNTSLDRINPKGGYTNDNIQLTTSLTNHAKMDSTDELFIEMCRNVTEWHEK
jgi:hypothetical protein